jgi:hypothetical protein
LKLAIHPAPWFETRGVAALLTMRERELLFLRACEYISDLILRRPQRGRLEG